MGENNSGTENMDARLGYLVVLNLDLMFTYRHENEHDKVWNLSFAVQAC